MTSFVKDKYYRLQSLFPPPSTLIELFRPEGHQSTIFFPINAHWLMRRQTLNDRPAG